MGIKQTASNWTPVVSKNPEYSGVKRQEFDDFGYQFISEYIRISEENDLKAYDDMKQILSSFTKMHPVFNKYKYLSHNIDHLEYDDGVNKIVISEDGDIRNLYNAINNWGIYYESNYGYVRLTQSLDR